MKTKNQSSRETTFEYICETPVSEDKQASGQGDNESMDILAKMRNAQKEEGFTLIELMIVVVIIGILAAIAIPIFSNQQKEAAKAGMKNDVRNLQILVVTYLATNPTATNLHWRFSNGAQQPDKALNNDAQWQKLVAGYSTSHNDTIMIIRDSPNSSNDVAATWENYNVIAANRFISQSGNYYYYYYDAKTGKYSEIGS